jgi:hypothetical protein
MENNGLDGYGASCIASSFLLPYSLRLVVQLTADLAVPRSEDPTSTAPTGTHRAERPNPRPKQWQMLVLKNWEPFFGPRMRREHSRHHLWYG